MNKSIFARMKEIVVSGIRPTGHLHLGNYFGAVRNFIRMQDDFNCFFFVADYHSLTTHPHPDHLQQSVRNVLAEYLACGLDPEKCTLYVQSDLPETAELYLLLNMLSYVGELERCTSFKDKIRQQPDNINAGLLTYPVLMAADILIHKAVKVPVGKDQEQHLEMVRNFAQRFNYLYGSEIFPLPVAFNYNDNLIKVPGLDGSGKMGKSEGEGNAIFITDDDAAIKKKIMRAVTDSGPTVTNSEKPEVIKNLFTLMSLVSKPETVQEFDLAYNQCTIRYGDMKKKLTEDMISFIQPIRQRVQKIIADDAELKRVTELGKEKAVESARQTLKEVRSLIGMRPY
jgi:tryptophanyl-tRNA synthetase